MNFHVKIYKEIYNGSPILASVAVEFKAKTALPRSGDGGAKDDRAEISYMNRQQNSSQ